MFFNIFIFIYSYLTTLQISRSSIIEESYIFETNKYDDFNFGSFEINEKANLPFDSHGTYLQSLQKYEYMNFRVDNILDTLKEDNKQKNIEVLNGTKSKITDTKNINEFLSTADRHFLNPGLKFRRNETKKISSITKYYFRTKRDTTCF